MRCPMPSASAVACAAIGINPPHRPTLLTPVARETVIECVRAGFTIDQITANLGVDRVTFYRWQHDIEEFRNAVARAREESAHALADKVHDLALSAASDPGERGERARGVAVCNGSLQWLAAKRLPSVYAERSAVAIDARVTVAGETTLTLADVLAASGAAKAGAPVDVTPK